MTTFPTPRATKMVPCPLCGDAAGELLEVIDADEVGRAWQESFGIDAPIEVDTLGYWRCSACALRFFDPPAAGGSSLYEALQRFDWYYMEWKPEFDLALSYLEHARSVLEIGAGSGSFATYLDGRQYVGLESNPRGIAAARERGIELRNESVDCHASADRFYDAVVAFQVLEHVPDPATFLRDCVRCLGPGGRLIVAVPAFDSFVGSAVTPLLNMPPHHVTHWPDVTFTHVAELLHVELVAVEHEEVSEQHEPWARAVLIERRLRRRLRLAPQLVDRRQRARVISAVAARLAARGFGPNVQGVRGHTVTAVFQLPS